jgi:hypothetical protein
MGLFKGALVLRSEENGMDGPEIGPNANVFFGRHGLDLINIIRPKSVKNGRSRDRVLLHCGGASCPCAPASAQTSTFMPCLEGTRGGDAWKAMHWRDR